MSLTIQSKTFKIFHVFNLSKEVERNIIQFAMAYNIFKTSQVKNEIENTC